MKKLIVLTLALMLALSLVACGAKDAVQDAVRDAMPGESTETSSEDAEDDRIDITEAAEEMVDEAVEHDSFSLAAATAFWNAKGVDFEAAAPDWDWTVDEEKMTTYGDTPDSSYGHASIAFEKAGGGEISQEEFQAWARKLFDATAAASDDGHNIIGWEFAGDGEDALSEAVFEDAIEGFMPGWGFMKDGKNMVVYLNEVYDTDKDSAIGRELYYYGAVADIAMGLQQSMDDAMAEADAAFEEYEDEIKDALEDYAN
jgi:predicted small lipoprotein YifL